MNEIEQSWIHPGTGKEGASRSGAPGQSTSGATAAHSGSPPFNPQAAVDLGAGKPGVRLHLPLKRSNLFLFTDFSETVVNNLPPPEVGELFEKTNPGLRGDFTALGFELGLSGYLGMDIQNHLGFDLSGRILATDVYGESAFALPSSSDESGFASAAGKARSSPYSAATMP
jgi:hypothetical protein